MWGVPDFVAAGIEAMQEAGVVGWLTRKPVGLYRDTKGRSEGRKVVVYRLDAGVTLPVWPEKRQRKAMWASVAVALEVVKEPGLRKLLRDCLISAEGEVSGD
jgi:hypothetical protein